MPITKLQDCYDAISTYSYQPDSDWIGDLLAFLQGPLSSQDQALLCEREKPLEQGYKERLLDQCICWLEKQAALLPFNVNDYDNTVEIFKSLINVLPFDDLNKPHNLCLSLVKINVFNLAFNHLELLCRKFHDTGQLHYYELACKWYDEVCLLVITKGFDLEVGKELYGNTVIFDCCQLIAEASEERDPMMKMLLQILAKTTQINQRNNLGMTPLSVVLRRGLPCEVLTLLIKHGASVNIQAKYKALHGGVLIPLLSFCIKDKNYEGLQFLLGQGADPNLKPEKEKIYCSDNGKNEMFLTPYQLAVAMNDAAAIDIFLRHAKRKGIALVACDIDFVPDWSQALSDSSVKVRGAKLALASKYSLFRSSENLVHELFDKLGVRCYVAHAEDKKNIVEGLRWLYGAALESSVAEVWRPILECSREKMRSGDFAIYVAEIPAEVSAHGSDCQGMFAEGNIYVLSGLSAKRYAQVIAHEAAHLFDADHIRLRKGDQYDRQAKDFITALSADIKNQPKTSMSSCVQTARDLYAEEGVPEKEFFAYLFIDELFQYPNDTKDRLSKFKHQLPLTFSWYQQNFMTEASQLSCR